MLALMPNFTIFCQELPHYTAPIVKNVLNDYVHPYTFPINERAFQLLKEYKKLRDNWDEDGAFAPTPPVIRQAEDLVRQLQVGGHKVFHVAPGPQGEIMVDIRAKGNSVEILFYPNKARVVFFPAEGQPFQCAYSDEMLPQIVKWLLHEQKTTKG